MDSAVIGVYPGRVERVRKDEPAVMRLNRIKYVIGATGCTRSHRVWTSDPIPLNGVAHLNENRVGIVGIILN
jgi:hypothetical protein